MTRTKAESPSGMLAGAIGDGTFKVVSGAAFVFGSEWISDVFGVQAWLTVVAGLAQLVGGGIEIVHVRRRPMATYLRLMTAYDIGWVVASAIALLMAWQGSTAGGEMWMAYLTAAPLAFAALLVGAPAAVSAPASASASVRPSAPDTPAS